MIAQDRYLTYNLYKIIYNNKVIYLHISYYYTKTNAW